MINKISTEKAFDALPYAVDIYEKLKVKEYISNVKKESFLKKKKGEKVDETIAGMDMFAHFLKNINKVKEEVFYLLSVIEDKDIEEVENQSMVTTIKSIKSIFEDKELVELFKSAM